LDGEGSCRSGDRGLVQSGVQDGFRIEGVLGEEAVAQDVRVDRLDVVRVHGRLAFQQGEGSSGGLKSERSTNGNGVVLPRQGSGSLAQGQEVALKIFGDGKLSNFFLKSDQVLQWEDTWGALLREGPASVKFEDIQLAGFRWEGHRNGKEKPVKLWFGQGEGSGRRGVILGGYHQERVGELLGFSINGNLPLVHRFEEGGLGPGRGAVDLVGEEQVGKDGTGNEIEFTTLLAIDIVSDNIGGKQVRGKLEPLEDAAK